MPGKWELGTVAKIERLVVRARPYLPPRFTARGRMVSSARAHRPRARCPCVWRDRRAAARALVRWVASAAVRASRALQKEHAAERAALEFDIECHPVRDGARAGFCA
jgi:hypothetical protein